jgi:hypothetical protein
MSSDRTRDHSICPNELVVNIQILTFQGVFALLGWWTALVVGSSPLTFRGNVSVSSRVKQSKERWYNNYRPTPHKVPAEQRPQLHRCGNHNLTTVKTIWISSLKLSETSKMKILKVLSDVRKELGTTPETSCRLILKTLKTTDNVQYNCFVLNDHV